MKNYFRHLSVICIMALFVTMLAAGCGSETQETAVSETAVEVNNTELTEEPSSSKITNLMNTYFTALKKGDVSALSEIMVNAPSKDTVKREIEYVEDYWNIKCYSTPGAEDNTWAAYVYYDVKFKNIDTAAPSMIREYICTNKEGNLYINNGTVDSDVASWLDSVHDSDEVTELLTNVNDSLTEAAKSDKELATLVSALGVSEETESASETTAAESTAAESTEAETTKAAESTEAETTKAKESTAAETTKANETTAAKSKKSSSSYTKFKKAKTMYTKDITNVRSKASTKSKMLGRLDENKKVTALGTKNGFTVIKYGKKKGYIKSDLLTSKKPKSATSSSFKSRNDKVEALLNVNLRKKPSTSAKSAGTLPGETVVKRTGVNKKWTRIKYKGKTYYVATKYMKKVS